MAATEPTAHPKVKGVALWMPWAAIVAGVAMVVAGVGRYLPGDLEAGDAAKVGQSVVSMDEWRRAVDAANAGRREPLDAAGESAVLQVLIDQELLLQLADRLELTRSLPVVRGQLVQAAMDALSHSAVEEDPDEAALRAFVASDPASFAVPERRRLRAWRHASREEAEAGASGEVVELPGSAMTQAQVQRWLGETLAARAFEGPGTGRLDPVAVGAGWYRVEVVEVVAGSTAAFDDLPADLVRREWERRRGEAALTEALAALREEAGVQKREALSR